MVSKAHVEDALKQVAYPGFTRDIVSFGLIKNIAIDGAKVSVSVALTTQDPQVPTQIKREIEVAIGTLEGVLQVEVLIAVTRPSTQTDNRAETVQEVRHIIAVASGKGGVGKSTVAANLACALDQCLRAAGNARGVGIMDCDIYGPSIPLMLGAQIQPEIEGEMLLPVESHGLKVMSMGLLIDETTPVVWRGPMIMKTIQQFATNVDWGQLECLVIDLPPGTGDAQLSLVQTLPLDGALIVTTPQTAAVNVARRGARMFEKVNVPLLGVVENMSYLLGTDNEKQYLFGEGGGLLTAQDLGTALIAQIPLEQRVREGGDNGTPIVRSHPNSPAAEAFIQLAQNLLRQLHHI